MGKTDMAVKVYHGDIVYTPSADKLAVYENSYIVVDGGKVAGISGLFGSACAWFTVCAAWNRHGLSSFQLAESLHISAGSRI